jgi:Ni,Fe-hydrogenase III small subunit/NAD-dependent dihydropyrimidine dehydrogenase PreA subunit
MFKFIKKGFQTGIVTTSYPAKPDPAPAGFRGRPEVNPEKCTEEDFRRYEEICPTEAMTLTEGIFEIDYGRCVFCGLCEERGREGAVKLTTEYEMASRKKEDLVLSINLDGSSEGSPAQALETLGEEMRQKVFRLFGRSLHIREVDSGSCNACEWEITALTNPIYDIQRFGIDFVASPRFADMLLVTGPVTRNMESALRKTYDAVPNPKMVVAVGACACDGGLFRESYATVGGLDGVLPVDVYIPGCPPRPQALLQGILLALNRFPQRIRKGRMIGGGSSPVPKG